MKPITLSMQAFGPFSGREQIAFSQLGQNPLFLINGPTGSGKTSILDAICFALYGETTGAERQGNQMRCDFASPETLTEVSLEFALGERRYRVTRSPEQEVPKARGEGTTVRKHAASLYRIDGDEVLISSKTSQVKVEVTQLLGLNESQFRQVMVLPQGQFRQLLLATSTQREEIFGQLFQTDIYKRIEWALKDRASDISKKKGEFDNQIQGALQVIGVETQAQLAELGVQLTPEFTQVREQEQQEKQSLEQLHAQWQQCEAREKDLAQLQQLETRSLELNANTEQVNGLRQQWQNAQQATKLLMPYKQWQSSVANVEKLTEKVTQLVSAEQQAQQTLTEHEAQYETAKLRQTERKGLEERLFHLKQQQNSFVERQRLQQESHQQQLHLEDLQGKAVQYRQHKEKLEQQFNLLTEQVNANKAQLALKPQWCAEFDKLNANLALCDKIDQQSARVRQLEKHIAQHNAEREHRHQAWSQANKNADQLELTWHQSQAAILAAKLQDDTPCPVCGSLEHPTPAQFAGEVVTQEQVKHAREQERQTLDAYNQQRSVCQNAQNEATLLEQQRQEWLAELAAQPINQRDELVAASKALSEQLNQLEQLNLPQQEQALLELTERCNKGEQLLQLNEQARLVAEAAIVSLNSQITKVAESLEPSFTALEQISAQVQSCETTLIEIEQAIERSQKQLEQQRIAHSQVATEHRSNQTWLGEANTQQVTDLAAWQQVLAQSAFASEDAFLAQCHTEAQILEWQTAIEQFDKAQLQLKQTIADLNARIAEQPEFDAVQLKQTLEQQTEAHRNVREKLDGLSAQYNQWQSVTAKVEQITQSNAQLADEYKVFGTLYDVASGKTGSRVSLHRFVLGVLLDDVLIQASERLSKMSRGRYIMQRKRDGFKGSAGRGLDLIVEDSYTGKSRDVATLSGGESFMAALSLALGLSDVVQSYSGGIRLDTLFIDEGFGSLDAESLDLAIEILIDLQQTGRMIGVISHVSELKEQMSQRIDIRASRTGSTLSLHSNI